VNRDPDAPDIERTLQLYLRRHPEDARGIERVLQFRERVSAEFERLVRESETPSPAYVEHETAVAPMARNRDRPLRVLSKLRTVNDGVFAAPRIQPAI
jgi:hypothetical protein